MQLSQTLKIEGRGDKATVSCLGCEHDFGSQSDHWKNAANLNEEKMNTMGAPYTTGEAVLLRSFSCPGCGVLLDTELAMAGEAFLEDKIFD
ncbi:MAG: acetone carboxylase gamma subunit [Planctomycetota bacterium]|jgi:acetone carboxylase gamma subunit